MKETKTIKKYGVFKINDARYYNQGASKVELIDGYNATHDTEEEAIAFVNDNSDFWLKDGSFIIMPIYIRETKETLRSERLREMSNFLKNTSKRNNEVKTIKNNNIPRTFSIATHGVSITETKNQKK